MAVKKGVKLDEPGGETISIQIKVNGKLVFTRHATITEQVGNNHRYTTDDGAEIMHNRSQGPLKLADKMLSKKL